jgi:ribosome-binding factor A
MADTLLHCVKDLSEMADILLRDVNDQCALRSITITSINVSHDGKTVCILKVFTEEVVQRSSCVSLGRYLQ